MGPIRDPSSGMHGYLHTRYCGGVRALACDIEHWDTEPRDILGEPLDELPPQSTHVTGA